MIRRNLKPALIFVLVTLTGATISGIFSCDKLINYNWTVQFGIGAIIFSLLIMAALFFGGILLFLLIKKRIKPDKYNRIKLIYFGILPLVIFHQQFLLIPENIMNRQVESSICNKTRANGMTTESANINLSEYAYLQRQLLLLPNLPETAETINISYYTDNFLGDFLLTVNCVCGINEHLEPSNRWTIVNVDKTKNRKTVEYTRNSN